MKNQKLPQKIKTVCNQDRDTTILNFDTNRMYIEDKYFGNDYVGSNLMYGNILLGTFDNEEDAICEMINIRDTRKRMYYVSGFSDWKD